MQVEDSLFKRPNYKKGIELNNCDYILLKPEFFTNLLMVCMINASHNFSINDNYHKSIKELTGASEFCLLSCLDGSAHCVDDKMLMMLKNLRLLISTLYT